nr:MAG TPA_asm: hypothetical protein [Caudoviricetes sp.]
MWLSKRLCACIVAISCLLWSRKSCKKRRGRKKQGNVEFIINSLCNNRRLK